ncbi:MAG: flagellar assembly protein A, partial [Candidatus Cloacimonadaceae bacterium]|nr:flagellar assembly protein A [Candidatus Cloacimonadaceae bacterium]
MSKIFTSSTGRVKIEVSEDAMTAMMTISRSGSLIDEREILELIDRAGIKYGLEAAVRKMNTEGDQKDFDTAFPLAICKANNATKQVRYHFDNPISSATDIAPDMLDKLTCVSEGTVIADYSFNIFEGDGSIYNIFGEMQAEATVTDLSDICGNGVEYDPKTSRFLAKV